MTADVIVLRDVLEHIADPIQFLRDVSHANGGQGAIYIEVPCFDWILTRRAWFDIFYEHVNYFRSADFELMFGSIRERGHLFGGQYLYVVADLASLRIPERDTLERITMPADFLSGIDRTISVMMHSTGKRNAIWGAASRGVIFSAYLQRAGFTLDEVIDINPAKQGRFLAVSGLQVSAPEEATFRLNPGDNVFFMNSNYLDEIVAQSRVRYTYLTVDHE